MTYEDSIDQLVSQYGVQVGMARDVIEQAVLSAVAIPAGPASPHPQDQEPVDPAEDKGVDKGGAKVVALVVRLARPASGVLCKALSWPCCWSRC